MHQRYGYFLENYKSAGDYEFWLRMSREGNMYRIPHVLGLYLAKPDGIELGDPLLSAAEAFNAVMLHQNFEGGDYKPLPGGMMKVQIGDDWVVANPNNLFEVIDELRVRMQEQRSSAETSKPQDE